MDGGLTLTGSEALCPGLDKRIAEALDTLGTYSPADAEYEVVADTVVKLYKLKNDDTKIERYIKLGAEIAGIVLPLMFYGRWMKKGFEFEQTGKFSSDTFRGLFMKFRPTGK